MVLAAVLGPSAVPVYGELHRQVLRDAGSSLSTVVVQAVTVAGNAMAVTLPAGGSAGAVVWSARTLARRGVPWAAATVTVATAGAVSTVVLVWLVPVLLTAAGVVAVPLGVGLAAAAVAVVVAGGAAARSPTALATALGRLLPLAARVSWPRLGRRLGPDPAATGREWAAQLRPLVPGPRSGALLFVTAVGIYLLDAAALAAAARSVLPVLPWAALVLGWVAGQIGMALQLTPGGLGLVETSLGGALLGAGLTVPQAAVVVAVYRGANWLLPALLGWVVYLLLALGAPRDLPRPQE